MDPEIADANFPDEKPTVTRDVGEVQVGTNDADAKVLRPFTFDT
jgi:hypothetical protein